MPSSLPLEIIYQIIDELATPAQPLAYEIEGAAHTVLLSFTVMCKGTHEIAMRHLYTRVSVQTVEQLDHLSDVSRHRLRDIRALCIDLNKVYVPMMDYMTGSENSMDYFHRHVTELLCDIFTSAHHIERLLLTLPRRWDFFLQPYEPSQETMSYTRQMEEAMTQMAPQLTEFTAFGFERLLPLPKVWKSLHRFGLGMGPWADWTSLSQFMNCMPVLQQAAFMWMDSDASMLPLVNTRNLMMGLPRCVRNTLVYIHSSGRKDVAQALASKLFDWMDEPLSDVSRWSNVAILGTPSQHYGDDIAEMCALARRGVLWDMSFLQRHYQKSFIRYAEQQG